MPLDQSSPFQRDDVIVHAAVVSFETGGEAAYAVRLVDMNMAKHLDPAGSHDPKEGASFRS